MAWTCLTARNLQIFDGFQSGTTVTELATRYGLSRQRIDEIVKAVAETKGEKKRDRLFAQTPRHRIIVEHGLLHDVPLDEIQRRSGATEQYIRQVAYAIQVPIPHRPLKKWHPSIVSGICRDRAAGTKIKDLCAKYHMSHTTLYRILRKHGIKKGLKNERCAESNA